jgi:hypothetical protein
MALASQSMASLEGSDRFIGRPDCDQAWPYPGNYAIHGPPWPKKRPQRGGKLGPSYLGAMPGAARHVSSVGLQAAAAIKFYFRVACFQAG